MAKTTTKQTTPLQSACEQYVVDELKQTKQELNATKHELELVKDELESLKEVQSHLMDTIKTGVKGFTIKYDETYVSIYYEGRFVSLERNDCLTERFSNLIALIMKGQNEVKREE